MSVRVLIADSSADTREMIRHHLECMGCKVVAEADNASQAADLFRTITPEVVTLNTALKAAGDLDALGLLRMIHRSAPHTSVITVGDALEAENREAMLNEGALECIAEPFRGDGFKRIWCSLSSEYPELRPVEMPGAAAMRTGGGHR